MKFKIFNVCAFTALLCSTAVQAQSIWINPFPEAENNVANTKPFEVEQIKPPTPVDTKVSEQDALQAFPVPQPGDNYFALPSQASLNAAVSEDTDSSDITLPDSRLSEPSIFSVRSAKDFSKVPISDVSEGVKAVEVVEGVTKPDIDVLERIVVPTEIPQPGSDYFKSPEELAMKKQAAEIMAVEVVPSK